MKTTAIVLAAGKGTRLGSDIPKQYIDVNGKPVLAYCLESFEKSSVDEVVIVTGADSIDYVKREIAERFSFGKVCAVIPGGSERYYSVLNGLMYIAEHIDPVPDYVLIHDGARPYITEDGINRMIDAVCVYKAAVAATPARDTIKITDRDGFVVTTTDRSVTWQVETPQCFEFNAIKDAYVKIVHCEQKCIGQTDSAGKAGDGTTECGGIGIPVTDDAGVYEMAYPDKRVKLVDTGSLNSKITTAADLEYMKYIFKEQGEKKH